MADRGNPERYMVIVADDDDEEAGAIAFFDTQEEAARHTEGLIAAGSEIGNISVFAIKALATRVHYRPVVTISSDSPPAPGETPDSASEPEPDTRRSRKGEAARS